MQNCVQKIPSTTLPNISINITLNLNNIFINISLFSYKIHKKTCFVAFIYFYQLKNEVKCRLRRIEKLTHHLGHHRTAVFQIILHHPLYQLDQEGFIDLHEMREFQNRVRHVVFVRYVTLSPSMMKILI